MFIPDPNFSHPGSRDPGSKRLPDPASRIRILVFTHPGPQGQKGTGSRIRIRNTEGNRFNYCVVTTILGNRWPVPTYSFHVFQVVKFVPVTPKTPDSYPLRLHINDELKYCTNCTVILVKKRPGPINYSGSGQKVPDTLGSDPTTTLHRTSHFSYFKAHRSTPFFNSFFSIPKPICSLRPQTSRKLTLLFLILYTKLFFLHT